MTWAPRKLYFRGLGLDKVRSFPKPYKHDTTLFNTLAQYTKVDRYSPCLDWNTEILVRPFFGHLDLSLLRLCDGFPAFKLAIHE